MAEDQKIVTLLTDFGTKDGYVGAMKGVLLSNSVKVRLVDISHHIQPYNIRQAAFALNNFAGYFPPNTIHLVVVDPGVGTNRKGLIVQTNDYFFIGPDNGVFSFIYQKFQFTSFAIREGLIGPRASHTFHGRDIFAPVVAELLNGSQPSELGEPLNEVCSFYEPFQKESDNQFLLKILHVDHFGNLILNFTFEDWKTLSANRNVKIELNHGFLYGIKNTFGEAKEGQILALWDSSGYLQIARNKGNASETLHLSVGDSVQLLFS